MGGQYSLQQLNVGTIARIGHSVSPFSGHTYTRTHGTQSAYVDSVDARARLSHAHMPIARARIN